MQVNEPKMQVLKIFELGNQKKMKLKLDKLNKLAAHQ